MVSEVKTLSSLKLSSNRVEKYDMGSSTSSIPASTPSKLGGDIAADWERFRSEWEIYEIATDLCDKGTKKRAAVFLACVKSAAHSVFGLSSSTTLNIRPTSRR